MLHPSGARYRVGGIEFAVLSDGIYKYDAGAVFGVVPRVMWERVVPPRDAMYRIELGLNCLLIRSEGRLVLIESGVGGKPGDRDGASPAEEGTLLSALAALDVAPADITDVVNTHLHADHCGWNTSGAGIEGDPLRPTFPNATHHLATQEWEDANHPNERTRATYLERNLTPIADHVRLLNGAGAETAITSEVRFLAAPGHTHGHGVVVLRGGGGGGGEWALFTGDLAQHRVQLERTTWVSGLDVLPLISMETKKVLMDRAIDEEALVIMAHGAYPGVARMTRTDRGFRQLTDVHPDLEG
ncbi:MAG: MBL fold metallo-hydrolase [Dehalococcoidia bacterium]|nr:MBL fold metallo-hydrolase [Dehalococcoidia bacterium]